MKLQVGDLSYRILPDTISTLFDQMYGQRSILVDCLLGGGERTSAKGQGARAAWNEATLYSHTASVTQSNQQLNQCLLRVMEETVPPRLFE